MYTYVYTVYMYAYIHTHTYIYIYTMSHRNSASFGAEKHYSFHPDCDDTCSMIAQPLTLQYRPNIPNSLDIKYHISR